MSVSILTAEEVVVDEEEESDENEESGHTDDEEDVDDINHVTLPKETVLANSPTQRPQGADISDPDRQVSKVRIFVHDVGVYPRCLEH